MSTVVIIGASVGGTKTAQALRSEGFTGKIVLIDHEHVASYDKPPLSKKYLDPETLHLEIELLSEVEKTALDATFKLGSAAVGLDPGHAEVTLASGEKVHYDYLVIATGSRARPSPWGTGPGIHVLRTSADAERLRANLKPGRRLVIVGAGFIGAEVASTGLKFGAEITMIDPLPAPMSRVLNEDVGNIFARKHIAEGVSTVFGHTVTALQRDGEIFQVELSNGTVVEADDVLVGIGAIPNTEWLAGSGLVLENGVVCDSALHALGYSNVFAVGDVARWNSARRNEPIRLEHWTNAVDQARTVAHNILHPESPTDYETVEYVWSDQYDWKIQVVGLTGAPSFELLGDPVDGQFAILYSEDEVRLTGAVIVNWPRALIGCRRAVGAGTSRAELRASLEANLVGSKPAPALFDRE